MTAMVNSQAVESAWEWPLRLDHFRRHERLSKNESDALQTLGFDLLRLDRDREHRQWQAISRLTAPLDEAVAALHWHPDTVFQRRFARYATAIVLHHCGELGRDFWSWSTQEWAELLRPQQLRQRFRGQIGMQARPYLLTHAYLLTGFIAFDLVGPFVRQTLAQRIFGAATVDQAVEPVRAVLNGWGYRAANLESTICGSNVPSRSLGTSIGTWPLASVNTVFGRVPLRIFVEFRSGGAWFLSCPRCSVISSFNAVSRTVLVNCLSSPSGPVSDRPCALARRTNSAAAAASAEGSALFFVTSSSVVILAPPCRAFTHLVGPKHRFRDSPDDCDFRW